MWGTGKRGGGGGHRGRGGGGGGGVSGVAGSGDGVSGKCRGMDPFVTVHPVTGVTGELRRNTDGSWVPRLRGGDPVDTPTSDAVSPPTEAVAGGGGRVGG